MKKFFVLLYKHGVQVKQGDEYFSKNFDYELHIKNSIYSFISQIISKKNFASFFIKEKMLYFKEQPTKIKKFFTGLVNFVGNLDDLHKKNYYWLLLNTELSKVVLRKVYNTNHQLVNDEKIKVQLGEFYEISDFLLVFRDLMELNDIEYLDFKERVFQNLIQNKFVKISFVKLMILRIFLLREHVGLKKLFEEPDFKVATKERAFGRNKNLDMKRETEVNIFKNAKKQAMKKKGFSCFRFDFMPTRPCYSNGRYVEGYVRNEKGAWVKTQEASS